jgi:hypothetical protein
VNLIDETNFADYPFTDPYRTVTLDGDYELQKKPTPTGQECIYVKTDVVNNPFYFWFWKDFPDLPNKFLRLEVTASVDTILESFGIGWQIVHNGQLGIVFGRANFSLNKVEVLNTTSPHIWTAHNNFPLSHLPKDFCKSFNIWLDCNPITFEYLSFGVQDNLTGASTVIPLNYSCVPTPNAVPNRYRIKINPKSVSGVQATARIGSIRVYELVNTP